MPSLLGLDLNCRDGFCNPAKDNFASANQSFFRDFGERGQVTNLDRSLGLRAGRDRQKAPEDRSQPL
jgi:hypothetical protein